MRMAVQDERDRVAADRLFETRAAEERIDLERLALDRLLNRRVVQQRDDLPGAEPRERGFELQRFVHRFVDEGLDDLLAPRAERAPAEAAAEPLHPGDADAQDLAGVAVEHDHPGVGEDLGHLGGLVGFEVVVAEDRGGRNAKRRQLSCEDLRLLGQAVVGQVSRQQDHISRFGDLREQALQRALRGFHAVQVADCCNSNGRSRHRPLRVQKLSHHHPIHLTAFS